MPVDINNDIIDLKALCKVIATHKKKFLLLQPIVLALTLAFVFFSPKTYRCTVEIAPELSSDQDNNLTTLLALINQTNIGKKDLDAVYPLMYPNVVFSDNFTVNLFGTKVTTLDGSVSTTYYDYLKNHTRTSLWSLPFKWIKGLFTSEKETASESLPKITGDEVVNLTAGQKKIAEAIQGNIVCVVDRKMGILTLIVFDQDPMVCTTMAATIAKNLKDFIINYRTNKARTDYNFCKQVYDDALIKFTEAQRKFVEFAETHHDITSPSFATKKEDLENDANNRRAILEATEIQLQTAKAKIQENTPVFTIIKNPIVPLEPFSPKPVLTVVFALLIANLGMLAFIFRKRLIRLID